MRIENYIEKLLYSHNCVVVPGFGAFLAHEKPAETCKVTHVFYPPSKSTSFNAQLCKNDGVLVAEIAKDKKLTYEALLHEVEKVSESWKKKLEHGESILLATIGKLWYNEEQKIQFQPEDKTNYLTASFGLSSFLAIPIRSEIQKEAIETLQEKHPVTFTPKKCQSSSRFWLKYAAMVSLTVSIGAVSYPAYKDIQGKQLAAQQNAQQQVSRIIQKATFFDSDPLELPALTIEVVKKQPIKYYVIAGAFRMEKNAERRIQQLKNKGYNAFHLGVNSYGLHQVAYTSFGNREKALVFLRKVQATESSDAWLLSQK